jgi:hypothetical protein
LVTLFTLKHRQIGHLQRIKCQSRRCCNFDHWRWRTAMLYVLMRPLICATSTLSHQNIIFHGGFLLTLHHIIYSGKYLYREKGMVPHVQLSIKCGLGYNKKIHPTSRKYFGGLTTTQAVEIPFTWIEISLLRFSPCIKFKALNIMKGP